MTSRYKRLLLKISGEVLIGNEAFGIDVPVIERLATEVASASAAGVELCLVVGGGNIIRGLATAARGMDRVVGDHMGMLATVMNALALESKLTAIGAQVRVQSALFMPGICKPYSRSTALRHLEKGRIVIFAAGTGNPYFTTDTAATLRAAEMNCDALFKGTSVDGVYSADPKTDPKALRYERIGYDDVVKQDLRVMDLTAIALARNSRIPVIVFSIRSPGALMGAMKGEGRFSIIGP
jgi:uridylate kinase